MIYLGMFSIKLFSSHDLDSRFGGLIMFDSSYFLIIFLKILSFNTRLTEN